MNEAGAGERFVRHREGRCGRSRCDDFGDVQVFAFERIDKFEQPVVSSVSGTLAIVSRNAGHVAIVKVKPTKLIAEVLGEADDFAGAVRVDAGSIHAGVDVDKSVDCGAGPGLGLLARLDENRNSGIGKFVRNVEDARRIRAHHGIREQHVRSTGLTANEQLERSRALEIVNAAPDHQTDNRSNFGGFRVGPPAFRITANELQGCSDIRVNHLGVNQKRGCQEIVRVSKFVGINRREHEHSFCQMKVSQHPLRPLIMNDVQVYTGAALAGAMSGMRSLSSPALISHLTHSGALPVNSKLNFLARHSGTATTTAVLAAGEFIADKLPFIPKRTTAGPLAGRAIFGALTGALVAGGKKRSWWLGAAVGTLGAIGATYAAYHLRRTAAEKLHLPDFALGLAEDGLVAGTGVLLTSMLRDSEAA